MIQENKPVAYLHYIWLTGKWIAYDNGGKVVAEHERRQQVIEWCEALGYRVVEAKNE